MFRQISILLFICFVGLSAFAQTGKYTVPVKWERYKVSDKDISILLPKLPVVTGNSDVCREQESKEIAVYADQTVYGLTITSKRKEKYPDYCTQKKGFDKTNFADRLVELKSSLTESTETSFKQNNLTVSKISGKINTYWLINDFDNKRWFEMWIAGGSEEKAEVKNFIKSIVINNNAEGIEISNGADRTFGDETVKTAEVKDGDTKAIIIPVKPQPKYTDAARKANTQGTITLKVTFLANGGIGNITIVDGLPYGLTEQAIYAAARLVFIPPKQNGISYAVSKTITYSFTIY